MNERLKTLRKKGMVATKCGTVFGQFGGMIDRGGHSWMARARGRANSKQRSTPPCDTKSFMCRVYSALRGIETIVSDHGLGKGQTMGQV